MSTDTTKTQEPPSSEAYKRPESLQERRRWKHLFRYERGEVDPDENPDDKREGSVTRKSLKRFWEFVRPHKTLVVVTVIFTMINQGMMVVLPLAIGWTMDIILPQKDFSLLTWVSIGLIAFMIVRALFLWVTNEAVTHLALRIIRDLRIRVHFHMQTMSLCWLENYQVGRICSRIMNDTAQIRELLFGGFINSASSAVRLIFAAGTLLYIDWQLTLVSSFVLPVFGYGFWQFVRRLRPAHKELSEDNARMWAKTGETFNGVRVVKTYARERREDLTFMQMVHEMVRKSLLIRRTHYGVQIFWQLTATLGVIALIWFGGYRVITGAMTVGELFAFYGLLGLLHQPIAELINFTEVVQAAMASVERVDEILSVNPEIADRPGAKEASRLSGAVVFEDVGFSYKSERPDAADVPEAPKARATTLSNVSFRVAPGECIALVGASGSGKTTVTNLLARLYDVDSGRVLVDGVDIRDYRLESYRRNIGMVLQDSFLFRGTIRENIAYSRNDATEEEIVRAAKMAGAWEFIQESDGGLDARCGERGVKLSGGQKQRISIARAILADPRILILDEATSALDSEAEAKIQRAMDELMKGRTTFIIAHRLSTIVNADRILVLDAGQIVESGTHEELLAREGRYHNLFMEQYGKFHFNGSTAAAIEKWRMKNSSARRRVPQLEPTFARVDHPTPLFGNLPALAAEITNARDTGDGAVNNSEPPRETVRRDPPRLTSTSGRQPKPEKGNCKDNCTSGRSFKTAPA